MNFLRDPDLPERFRNTDGPAISRLHGVAHGVFCRWPKPSGAPCITPPEYVLEMPQPVIDDLMAEDAETYASKFPFFLCEEHVDAWLAVGRMRHE